MRDLGDTPKPRDTGNRLNNVTRGIWSEDRMTMAPLFDLAERIDYLNNFDWPAYWWRIELS